MNKALRWLCGMCFMLAACTPDDAPIPTLAQFATLTPTPQPTLTPQSIFADLPPTFTPTNTEVLTSTYTPTPAPSLSPSVTVTPSATITDTPSPTWTPLPSIDPNNRPLLALALTAEAATVLPTDFEVPAYQGTDVTLVPAQTTSLPAGVPSPIPPLGTATLANATSVNQLTCTALPVGGFGAVFVNNPDVAAQLGCPLGAAARDVPAAWQAFQQGVMVWLNGEVLVFYRTGSQFQSFGDTFIDGVDPETSSETAPEGFYTPIRGFLKVWSNNPPVHDSLGWALNPEQGVTAKVLNFENGRMLWLPGRGDIFVLLSSATSGTWQSFAGTF